MKTNLGRATFCDVLHSYVLSGSIPDIEMVKFSI